MIGDDRSVFCSNEVILGGILNSFRMGAGHQKDPKLGTLSPTLYSLERREGQEMELIIDCASMIEASIKIPVVGVWGASR